MNFKKITHHLIHSRPKWYHDYHKWKFHKILHWASFVISSSIIIVGFLNVLFQTFQSINIQKAYGATTTLTQDITGGSLTISNTGNQSLGSVTVSTSAQDTTGSLGTITVNDARGTGAGWTSTATSTNFYKINSAVKISGSNNTLTVDGSSTYATSSAGTYTVTISTGGSVGSAKYDVSGLESSTGTTTGAGVPVGTQGVTVTFASATYVIGDSWTIRVDTIPVTAMNITPGSVTTITGSSTNVTGGSFHVFNSTIDATTLMTASYNYGMGSYSVAPNLKLHVPPNGFANIYTATVTETVS